MKKNQERVKPLRPIIPEEFSPNRRLTSKKFTFNQPVPRAKSLAPKTFEDESPDHDEEAKNGSNENNKNTENQENNENNENEINNSKNENNNNENNTNSNEIENQGDKENNLMNEAQLRERKLNGQNDDQNDNEAINHDSMPNSAHSMNSQNSNQSTQRSKKNMTILDDEEMQSMRQTTAESHDFSEYEEETMARFVQYMKEYVKFVASKAEYEEAKKAKELYDESVKALYHKRIDRTRSDAARKKYEQMKAEKEEKWQNELDLYDLETNEKLESLTRKQEEERKEFDLNWSDEKTLRRYRKPSRKLLDLWRMEKFLAKQNKFDEAAVAHAESEELSKREMAMCQAMANRDYHNEKEKLIEKQESDMTLLLQTREHWREVLLSRQKQEKDYFYRREAVVEIMEQEPLRTREAQLNVKTAKSRSPNKSKNSARLLKSAEISFQYCTVLPPLAPPVTGNNSQASSEYGGNKGRASSQCGSAKSRSSNSSRSGSNSRRQDRNMENDE